MDLDKTPIDKNNTPSVRDMSNTFSKNYSKMEETQATPEIVPEKRPDILLYVKEKHELQIQLRTREEEMNRIRCRNYDLSKKVDELEQQMKQFKGLEDDPSTKQKRKNGRRRKKRRLRRPGLAEDTATESTEEDGQDGPRRHPKVIGLDDGNMDSFDYYTEVARRVPGVSLQTVLDTEERFLEADTNGDDTLDIKELGSVLKAAGYSYTRPEMVGIMKEIDTDKTGTVDFIEALKVVDMLHKNKAKKLAASLKLRRSTVCTVQ